MKAKTILFGLAAMMMMFFVACDKEEETTEVAANTMVYNGKVYQMNSTYSYDHSGRVYIDAHAVETLADGQPIFSIISDNPANGTYDLVNGGGVFFGVTSEVDYITSYSSQDTYTSGAVTVEKDESAFRLKMKGTLEDGTTVGFHIYVPASEWRALEF